MRSWVRVLVAAGVVATAGLMLLPNSEPRQPATVRVAVVTDGRAAPLVQQLLDESVVVEAVYRQAFDGAVAQVPVGRLEELEQDPQVLAVDQLGPARDLVARRTSKGVLPGQPGPIVYVLDSPVVAADPWFEEVHVVDGFTAHPVGEGCADHGSAVAGVVAGQAGLVRGVPVVSVAVSCRRLDDRSVLDALEWVAAAHPPETSGVLNVSLALPGHASLEAAVRGVAERGVVPVVAAGNRGADACSGLVERIRDVALIVGAVDIGLRRSGSNFGPCVDVFALGQGALTTDGRGGVRLLGGTSSAAPRVTGEVARRLQDDGLRPVGQVIAEVVEQAAPKVIQDAGPGSPDRVVRPAPAEQHYPDQPTVALLGTGTGR